MPSDRPLSSDNNRLAKDVGDQDGPHRRSRPPKRRDQLSIPSDRPLPSDEGTSAEIVQTQDVPRGGQPTRPKRSKRRFANLYDAVAARVTPRGFLSNEPFASKYRDTASSGARILRPEEVLFRKQRLAKQAIDESYFAHEDLPADQPLPSSELLKALHVYAAEYYEFATADNGKDDSATMDGTALLAMGILIEELAREALGDTGDLVLVEGEELSEDEKDIGLKSNTSENTAVQLGRKEPSSTRVRKSSKRRKSARPTSVTKRGVTKSDQR